MQPKPDFYDARYGAAFQEAGVARSYRYRPTYPAATFDVLADLITDSPRHVLDAGCGTGAIALPLVERVDRIDAVDVSQEMINQGKQLPSGDHPHLTWIVGRVEDAPLQPPYALITTGQSIHWMDWYVVMPRFAQMLTPRGFLAILDVDDVAPPWQDGLVQIIKRYSTIPRWQAYDHIKGLEERGLFQQHGTWRSEPFLFTQSLDDYIESFHARASFARGRMAPANIQAFDEEVRALVSSYSHDVVELQIVAEIVWGKPLKGN